MAEADAQSASAHFIQKDMKKTLLLALAVLASATFNVASAAKKKKKEKKEAAQPVQLATSSDTLSYAIGTVMTNGLIPYLQQAEGIDTAYMADFIRGFDEMIKAADDPRLKAYSAGMGIATRLKGQMLAGMEKEFTDTPDSIVPHIVFRAFTDALKGDGLEVMYVRNGASIDLFAKNGTVWTYMCGITIPETAKTDIILGQWGKSTYSDIRWSGQASTGIREMVPRSASARYASYRTTLLSPGMAYFHVLATGRGLARLFTRVRVPTFRLSSLTMKYLWLEPTHRPMAPDLESGFFSESPPTA